MPAYRIYTAPTPYNAVDLAALNYAQVADVVYFAHRDYPPEKLIRAGHTDWTWQAVTFAPTITAPIGMAGTVNNPNVDAANSGNAYFPEAATYSVTAVDNATGQESRASTGWTGTNDLTLKRNYNELDWTAHVWTTSQGGFYKVYRARNTALPGYIGSTSTNSFIDDNIDADTSSAPPTGYNPFPGAGDYPGVINFHEERSWWGNTINRPNAIFGSRSADYENMDYRQPGEEDDSLAIALVGKKVNVVNQLASTKQGLLALTSNAVFSIEGANGDYIAATPPPKATKEITRGVSALPPIEIDAATLYQTVKTGEIRALGYQFQIDGLSTDDVSIFSRHLFDNRSIVDWCWVEKPHSAILAVRDDGVILALTWDQAQQVWGWTTWETDGEYLGVCAITEENEDRVYAMVKRTISGADVYNVERFASDLWSDPADACYLDCAKSYVNADTSVTVFDRLDHLEGRTVVAWIDGAICSNDASGNPLVVVNGAVTLPYGGMKVTIGLPFTAEIETLPLALQLPSGWTVARPQDAGHTVLKVINTRSILAGPDADHLYEVKQREYEDFGEPTALFTGSLDVDMAGIVGNEVTVVVRSEDPAPMEIVGVLVEPNVGSIS